MGVSPNINLLYVTLTSLGGWFDGNILLKSKQKGDLAQYPAGPPIRIRVNEANFIRCYSTSNCCVPWKLASHSCTALEFTAANEWISLATSSGIAYIIARLMVGVATRSSNRSLTEGLGTTTQPPWMAPHTEWGRQRQDFSNSLSPCRYLVTLARLLLTCTMVLHRADTTILYRFRRHSILARHKVQQSSLSAMRVCTQYMSGDHHLSWRYMHVNARSQHS